MKRSYLIGITVMVIGATGAFLIYQAIQAHIHSIPISPQPQTAPETHSAVIPISDLNADDEKSLALAVEAVKVDPSDTTLAAFEDFAQTWLETRLAALGDTNLAEGDRCLEYVGSKPEYHLISGTFDDVCTLEIDQKYYNSLFMPSATLAGKGYLEFRLLSTGVGFQFMENAELTVAAEKWLNKFKTSSVLADRIKEINSKAVSNLFYGVGDGFMPLVDDKDQLLPDARKAYEWLSQQHPESFSGRVAKEILPMLAKADFRYTPEVRQRRDLLLKKDQ